MFQCEVCQSSVATVHTIEVVDGKASEHHLCSGCAKTGGVVQNAPTLKIPEFIENLLASGKTKRPRVKKEAACPGCGMTYQQFKVRGRLGCARCYEVFKKALIPLLEKIHDATKHTGKFPVQLPAQQQPQQPQHGGPLSGHAGAAAVEKSAAFAKGAMEKTGDPRPKRLDDLRKKLEEAKLSEAYEEAARIRDEIRRLEAEA
jgi:protein arginine kinase activator